MRELAWCSQLDPVFCSCKQSHTGISHWTCQCQTKSLWDQDEVRPKGHCARRKQQASSLSAKMSECCFFPSYSLSLLQSALPVVSLWRHPAIERSHFLTAPSPGQTPVSLGPSSLPLPTSPFSELPKQNPKSRIASFSCFRMDVPHGSSWRGSSLPATNNKPRFFKGAISEVFAGGHWLRVHL